MPDDALFDIVNHVHAGSAYRESNARINVRRIAHDLGEYAARATLSHPPRTPPGSALADDDSASPSTGVADLAFHAYQSGLGDAAIWAVKASDARLDHCSDYSLVRAMIEKFATCVWLLGPDESSMRIQRALRLKAAELADLGNYIKNLERLDPGGDSTRRGQLRASLAAQVAILRTACQRQALNMDLLLGKERVSHSHIATEAGRHLTPANPLESFATWSVASGLVHVQPFYSNQMTDSQSFVLYDDTVLIHRATSAFQLEPFAKMIWQLLERAVELYNFRLIRS